MHKFLFTCSSVLACCAMAASPDLLLIPQLADAASVPAFVHLRDTTATMVPEHKAIKINYPKWKPGTDEWPTFIVDRPNGGFVQDWFAYRYLAFDVYCYASTPQRAMLRLDDAKKHVYDYKTPLTGKGQKDIIIIELKNLQNSGHDLKDMRHFDFYQERPNEDLSLELANIRLTNQPYPAEYVHKLADKASADIQNALAQIKPLKEFSLKKKLFQELTQNLATLQYSDDAGKLVVCQSNWLAALPEQLHKVECYAKVPADSLLIQPIPTTLKIRQDQFPERSYSNSLLNMHAARGEAESLQLLISNAETQIQGATFSAEDFQDNNGNSLKPEISVLGYVPVKTPTAKPNGFGTPGNYPDVLLPNRPFDVAPYQNQALWLSVWVPENAVPGIYRSRLTVSVPGKQASVFQASLQVYPVTVPKRGKLRTCWVFQPANTDKWFKGDYDSFLRLNLKYRFAMDKLGSCECLPWNTVFKVDAQNNLTEDWTQFDQRIEYWHSQGKNTFMGYPPRWFAYKPIEQQLANPELERKKLQLAVKHLREKGWIDEFYLYMFDEPSPDKKDVVRQMCKFFQDAVGHDAHVILTACHPNSSDYVGAINIYVPHITQFVPDFMAERQRQGDHVWMYTCCGTLNTRCPDTWKIDFFGTGHRAVGWWLYKYNVEGYLYWGVNYWDQNPWTNTMTFPRCNGDGSMFYPNPDRKSQPWPSIRAEIVRDGFEDYELLHLLAEKASLKDDPETQKILSCLEIIPELFRYNEEDDLLYQNLHRRILELLSK